MLGLKFTGVSDRVNNSSNSENVPLTQFVADNIHHNIETLDGYGTFHGMNINAASVYLQEPCDDSQHRILRCKATTAGEAISEPIKTFNAKNSNMLRQLELHLFVSLMQPLILNVTNLWHVGRALTYVSKTCPDWSVFFKVFL